jgi:hypothetical protein
MEDITCGRFYSSHQMKARRRRLGGIGDGCSVAGWLGSRGWRILGAEVSIPPASPVSREGTTWAADGAGVDI